MSGTTKSKNSCCVVNCSNSYKNTNNITFYRLPNRDYEKETKEKWIKAINRIIENRKPWRPSVHSVVCSAHFINNNRSLDPRSPSYIPSIFPEVYKKKNH
ncbi:unnamed protein product [Macrosiphum euphorbiae]|uniref:THAP-type domain-containing protein n=1 Tax=Macrosiphum euphorbiae TaxID=13131 RepID=A0AAV0WM13_9HEMI|nr:unnamed protein product [Macrosiphum euphorbiae]